MNQIILFPAPVIWFQGDLSLFILKANLELYCVYDTWLLLLSEFHGAKVQGLNSYHKENPPEDPNKHYEEEEKREGAWNH